jgi:hypothetical protein
LLGKTKVTRQKLALCGAVGLWLMTAACSMLPPTKDETVENNTCWYSSCLANLPRSQCKTDWYWAQIAQCIDMYIYIYYLYIYLFISCLSWQLKLCKVNTSKNSRVHTAEDFGLEAAPYVYKITNVKSSKQALRHPDSMQAIQHRSSNTSPSPPKPLKLFARLPLWSSRNASSWREDGIRASKETSYWDPHLFHSHQIRQWWRAYIWKYKQCFSPSMQEVYILSYVLSSYVILWNEAATDNSIMEKGPLLLWFHYSQPLDKGPSLLGTGKNKEFTVTISDIVTMLWDTFSRNRCLPRLLTSTSQCRLLPPTGLVYTLQVEQIIVSRSEANWAN